MTLTSAASTRCAIWLADSGDLEAAVIVLLSARAMLPIRALAGPRPA